jgi:hypothetical protein
MILIKREQVKEVIWDFLGLLCFILALLFLSGCSSNPKPSSPTASSLTLRANKRILFHPSTVVFTGIIKGPAEDWYCPRITWLWGDDTKAEWEADCTGEPTGSFHKAHNYTQCGVFRPVLIVVAGYQKRTQRIAPLPHDIVVCPIQ